MGYNTYPPQPFPPNSVGELNKIKEDLSELQEDISDIESDISDIESDINNLGTTKANQITIAPTFNSEDEYSVGNIVYYNGLTYKCVNAHTGEWNTDDFIPTTIALELESKKQIDYSTTEQNTGLKWYDGKDIYTKLIVVDNPEYTQIGQIYESEMPFVQTGYDTVMAEWVQAFTSVSSRPLNDTRTDLDVFGYYVVNKEQNKIYIAINTNTYTKFVAKVLYTKSTI